MDYPIFSFGIVSYKNYRYIYEAVDSLLQQDYPWIELIIANDASEDFRADELSEYIESHKKNNIVSVLIQNHATNIGTVRNIEWVRQHSTGEYIMYMAADDALYDSKVLSRYAHEFQSNSDILVVSSKTAMCGNKLDDVMEYIPNEEGIHIIRDFSPVEMFSYETHTFLVPTTSTCYRRKLYDIIGPYDTDYYIIEDASLYLRMARMGIGVHWVDNMVGARHRDGGISHGNTVKLTRAYQNYRFDEIVLYCKEILPYQDMILESDRKLMEEKWRYIQYAYYDIFERPNLPIPKTKWGRRKYYSERWMAWTKRGIKLILSSYSLIVISLLMVAMGVSFFACIYTGRRELAEIIWGIPSTGAIILAIYLSICFFLHCISKIVWNVCEQNIPEKERKIYVSREKDTVRYQIDPKPPAIDWRKRIRRIVGITLVSLILVIIEIVVRIIWL